MDNTMDSTIDNTSIDTSTLPPASQSQLVDSGGEADPYDMASASSDQACKECRRRKARCNRALPTCDLCTKYRRHCLYEKHSRTPLTRKHLTDVETKLERAEALVRRMRPLIPPHLRTWERGSANKLAPQPAPHPATGDFQFSSAPGSLLTETSDALKKDTGDFKEELAVDPSLEGYATNGNNDHQKMLEGPPLDDFEWSESDPTKTHGLSPEMGNVGDEEGPISDGMAALSVNESQGGYLGVASGAALLRLLEPASRRRMSSSRVQQEAHPAMYAQPNPNRHVAEAMIDSYFRCYHVHYPAIHEPTFRAQYSEIIPRPNGPCWTVLAYVVAAIGVWTSASTASDTLDLALFSQARSILNFNFLEVGNLTLVQALTLSANYLQKRDKPNSGYTYLGLAARMAMGLGLHKEFQGWNISPLKMEIRRRVWWTLFVFDVGATITFSRPNAWPSQGVEVSIPLNVNDKDLTAASTSYPPENDQITPYTAVGVQGRFHTATGECYTKVISKPFPSADELMSMEAKFIEPWLKSVPAFFNIASDVPPRYALAQVICDWRLRNLRIIMYRPFVIRRALNRRAEPDSASVKAYERCLTDAKATIESISEYWRKHEHNRLSAWYALYFLFQAALIPCICLRNEPSAPQSPEWRRQIITTLEAISAIAPQNATSGRCHSIILGLCGRFLDDAQVQQLQLTQLSPGGSAVPPPPPTSATLAAAAAATAAAAASSTSATAALDDELVAQVQWPGDQPTEESPQTQINNVLGMMWPNVPPMEAADVVMGDDAAWMEFLKAGSGEGWGDSTFAE